MSNNYSAGALNISTGVYNPLSSASTVLRPLTATKSYEVYFTQPANVRWPASTGTAGTAYIEFNLPANEWNFIGNIDPSKFFVRATGATPGTFNVRDA